MSKKIGYCLRRKGTIRCGMIPCATCLMLGYACRVYGSHRVYILCDKPKGIRTGREGPASLQSCQMDIPSPHLRTFRLVPYYHTKQRVVDLSGLEPETF